MTKSPHGPLRVGIGGPVGSGKTTLTEKLCKAMRAKYSVAAGTACATMGIDKDHALLAWLQGFAATLTSVAVRLVPIGQTAGLEVLRDLAPVIARTAERAASATLDDLGTITIGSEIAAMKHETQHSRVFRT